MKQIPDCGLAVTHCRFCGSRLSEEVADLGAMPPANDYVPVEASDEPQPSFPLNVMRCAECHLVQVGFVVPPHHIFEDYAYFSSYSTSWVEHARRFAHDATDRYDLSAHSLVVEVGSNDGYLLKHFVEAGVPVLGVDPAANVVDVALQQNVPTRVAFFGEKLAAELRDEGRKADLIVGNNVFAHVPDINGFTEGLSILLAEDGAVSLEFPHLLRLLEQTQFDTIYHEHYSYYSLLAVENIMRAHGLRVFDVKELPTHGGSIRVMACHADSERFDEKIGVQHIRELEAEAGLDRPEVYADFAARLPQIREGFREFVLTAAKDRKRIAGYSAPAKGNTFLNYCGISADDVDFVADLNPAKQNHLLPGSRIPIRTPEDLYEAKPDYVLILAWNLKEEISKQLARISTWGGRFVVGIPFTEILLGS